MTLSVLGISASPRPGGNTDLLTREALRGAESAGARTEFLTLRGLGLSPCVECYACATTGLCRIDDDFQPVFEKLLAADRLIFGSPVFFMAVSAQAKLLIDRCQCLWSRKYLLKQPLFADGPRDRRALVIAVGGSRSRNMFDCVRLTMKYWFDALEMTWASNLFVNQVDAKADVLKHPQAMAEAFRLGAALAAADAPVPREPATVELFGPAAGRAGT
jgi:multimeric flavodoxin WrbA